VPGLFKPFFWLPVMLFRIILSTSLLAIPVLAIKPLGERWHLRQSGGIVAGSEQSGIATRKDRANRARHADIRGRMTNYSKGKLRHQSDKDPTQSPIEKSYRDDYVAANQIRPIRFADYYCCCCCCCSCSVRALRGANTGRDWITMLGATGSGSGAAEGLTVTATLSSLCASPL
jgi:hypothetical protein